MYRKYLNKKTVVDGISFDSKKEARHYVVLKECERKGEISNLRLQVSYELVPAVWETRIRHLKTKDKEISKCIQRPITYVADFVYVNNSTGAEEVVDTKGFRTQAYKLKKKMMLAFKGINIIEI